MLWSKVTFLNQLRILACSEVFAILIPSILPIPKMGSSMLHPVFFEVLRKFVQNYKLISK
jgi:hypothetical protein